MTKILTRPIIGIENRTAQEVFDIMCDRILPALSAEPVAWRYQKKIWAGDDWIVCNHEPTVSLEKYNIEPLFTSPPDQSARIADLRARLAKAVELMKPFATVAKIVRTYHDTDVMPAGPIKVADVRATAQFVKANSETGQ